MANFASDRGTAEVALIRALSASYRTPEAALAELAGLRGTLALAAPTIHLISDVHGEYAKLRHVINNASGALRPAVEGLMRGSLTETERRELLAVIYYPGEVIAMRRDALVDAGERSSWVRRTLKLQFELVRKLSSSWRRDVVEGLYPEAFRELFQELFNEPMGLRPVEFYDLMVGAYEQQDRDFDAVRAASRLIRNLSAQEILVAGDLGDRGPRMDRVIDFLMQQPPPQPGNSGGVRFVWGNHDAHWMGACLGHGACICSVLRFSLRYGRLEQLEEGYGIVLDALEKLASTVYGSDEAKAFGVKATGGRDALLLARMQKAVAVLQLKLEGQLIGRHPEWKLGERDLLKRIDLNDGIVKLQGHHGEQVFELLDRNLPTVKAEDPNALSPEEAACMKALQAAFVGSPRLWEQMRFVVERGSMWTRREELLVFHACVPVDKGGTPLAMNVLGRELSGRELMDALTVAVKRMYREGVRNSESELDLFWYLWCGPASPLFGKDKIATFEGYFVADKDAKHESKNPYFEMIHDAGFVQKIGRLFGMGDDVMIVNGHVPVKVEKGEQPLKRGGNAVTIDGAFSEAYGDRGYSLVMSASGIVLAEHSHFESVEAVVEEGKDMIPRATSLRVYSPARKIGDTVAGAEVRERMHELERLVGAYGEGRV